MTTAHEITVEVAPEDIDELGHVNNIVYLRWIQDVATAHWRAAAPPDAVDAIAWVVRRHEIDYRHPALPGDRIADLRAAMRRPPNRSSTATDCAPTPCTSRCSVSATGASSRPPQTWRGSGRRCSRVTS